MIDAGLFWVRLKSMRGSGYDGLNNADWVVNMDADAVLAPQRLRNQPTQQADTYTGVYVENCEGVKYSYSGNLKALLYPTLP